jgi:DNA-binding response OmpR family regulator
MRVAVQRGASGGEVATPDQGNAPNRRRDLDLSGGMSVHKILIVDDDNTVRDLLPACLSPAYEARDMGGPEQAMALALENKPDAILLDLMMRKFSGFELCQSFCSLSYTSAIPIIVITGESGAKYKDHRANLEADAYFDKPLKLDERERRLTTELRSERSEQCGDAKVPLTEGKALLYQCTIDLTFPLETNC